MAASTAARTSGETRAPPLTTLDTVARETPAAAATVSSVGEPDPSGLPTPAGAAGD